MLFLSAYRQMAGGRSSTTLHHEADPSAAKPKLPILPRNVWHIGFRRNRRPLRVVVNEFRSDIKRFAILAICTTRAYIKNAYPWYERQLISQHTWCAKESAKLASG